MNICRSPGAICSVVFMLLVAMAVLGPLVAPVQAAQVAVEIFYLPHGPVMAVLGEVEKVISEFPDIEIREYDFEDPATRAAVERHRLTGHIPIAIFINGLDTFEVAGQQIMFRNFPRGNAFVPTLEGKWHYDDLREVFKRLSGAR